MLPDRVSNPGPLTYESGALPKEKLLRWTIFNFSTVVLRFASYVNSNSSFKTCCSCLKKKTEKEGRDRKKNQSAAGAGGLGNIGGNKVGESEERP